MTLNKHVIVYTGVGVLIFGAVIFGVLYFMQGTAGKPVPVPKRISFDVGSEGGSGVSAGEIITIQPEQLKNAGILFSLPSEVIASDSISLSVVGTVASNPYRDVPVFLPAPGRVTSITTELGRKVSEGQVLAMINSTEFAGAQTNFLSAMAELENARLSAARSLRLAQVNDEAKSGLENARRDLQSLTATLDEASTRKQRFERLFAVGAVSRQMLDEEIRKYSSAVADAEESRRRLERATALLEINNEARSRIEESERRLRRAEGDYSEARRKLSLFGLDESQINRLRKLEDLLPDYPLRSPIAGEITSRSISKGEFVDSSRESLRVTDVSSLWVLGQVAESDLNAIRIGTKVDIALQINGEVISSGRVSYIAPSISEATRTTQVRVETRNEDGKLKIGSYVRMRFQSDESNKRSVPAVATSAVQVLKGNSVVFVAKGNAGEFEVRVVRTGKANAGLVPILEGLELNERVVTSGSFLLRAEYLKRDTN
jgi:RND family efflux transporter MFP subunit